MDDDFLNQIEAARPLLMRFAELQLRDRASAEDAVQETILAAIEGRARFRQAAQVRTWMVGILRHKIVDAIRRRQRESTGAEADAREDAMMAGAFDGLFDAREHWNDADRPADWGDPEGSLESGQFWAVFEACLTRLPARTAQVFTMREVLGFETAEICQELGLSATHCWVVLHRARMALRLCLDADWFGTKEARC